MFYKKGVNDSKNMIKITCGTGSASVEYPTGY
jgi:hypothetical protein